MRPQRQDAGPAGADLTDREWAVIAQLFPKVRGLPRGDDRRILDGIVWRLRTGRSWSSIPARYGRPTTCRSRFARWRQGGTWDRIVEAVMRMYDGQIQPIAAAAANIPPCWRDRPAHQDIVAWRTIDGPALCRAA